jgi:8-oxo-dGTP diphosphatase
LPPYFTLSQLQKVYESILGKRVDKRNFRKRMLALGLVRPT